MNSKSFSNLPEPVQNLVLVIFTFLVIALGTGLVLQFALPLL